MTTKDGGMHADTINGGWREAIAGWLVSGYGWLFADMPGIAALVAIATLILTAIKILDAVRSWRATDHHAPMRDRIKSTFSTQPAPLDDRDRK